MPNKHFPLFCLTVSILFPFGSEGQRLAEDIRQILVVTDALPLLPDQEDRIVAADKLLQLLHHYTGAESTIHGHARSRRQRFRDLGTNPYLAQLAGLPWDSLLGPAAGAPPVTTARPGVSANTGGVAAPPAAYLSATRLLRRYQTPAKNSGQYLRRSASDAIPRIRAGVPVTQTVILQATADFILKRAREEVAINFLDQLANQDVRRLPCWFPAVTQTFHRADQLLSHAFLAQLQGTFLQDLETLPFRLPTLLLSDSCGLKAPLDSQAYQLLTVYAVLGQLQTGSDPADAAAGAHRLLYDLYAEQTKASNLLLAGSLESDPAALSDLVSLATSLQERVVDIYGTLVKLEDEINSRVLHVLMTVSEKEPRTPPPLPQDYLDGSLYQFGAVWGEKNEGFDRSFLPQLLQGAFDPAEVLAYNTLEGYDQFFGKDWTPRTMRAVGLELLQNIGGEAYGRPALDDLFGRWLSDLSRYHQAVEEWAAQASRRPPGLQDHILATRRQVEQTRDHWRAACGSLSAYDELRFAALLNLTGRETLSDLRDAFLTEEEYDPDVRNQLVTEALEAHLGGVIRRLETLEASLRQQFPSIPDYLPEDRKGIQSDSLSMSRVREKIAALAIVTERVRGQLSLLEQAGAPTLSMRRQLSTPLLQVTRLASDLLFFLQADTTNRTPDPDVFSSLLQDPPSRDLVVGLLLQRWRNGRGPAHLSPTGLEDILLTTVQDLPLLSGGLLPDSIRSSAYAATFGKVFFTFNVLQRILETPLLPTAFPEEYQSVLEAYPGPMDRFPALSRHLTHFVYYCHIRDHGRAITSLGSLVRLLEETKQDAGSPPGPAAVFLERYGPFVGGLLEATETAQVEALLDEVADPPGSSRIKRTARLSAGINAYLGANAVYETWSGSILGQKETITRLVPTIPVGVNFSLRVGTVEKPHSFSAYLSMLDLGAALDFSHQEGGEAETSLTVKNVFKPSFQLHYNIRRTPFYLGAGWQGGPQFVDIAGRQASVRTSRYFFGLGVDVPLFTLYRR